MIRSAFTRGNGEGRAEESIWALKDVSFEVKRGEVLGVIGRNGAGKSTLLKILSRITEPTEGFAEVHGRVGSLLEVGTGFHPELSGRENIYLNGAILGMRRGEIDRKFDEMVAFAEVEKFIDTPVKHYSSGMYLRLAFAVAAHLQPEILLVDEVLAVGDAEFQKKCLGKMQDVAQEGRTVLFVSHNLAAVQSLCSRGIVLRNGSVWMNAGVRDAVAGYLRTMGSVADLPLWERKDRTGKGLVRLTSVDIATGGTDGSNALIAGWPAEFVFHLTSACTGVACTFTIYDERGQPVANFNSARRSSNDTVNPDSDTALICTLEENLLLPGDYRINVAISCEGELQDHVEGAATFSVSEGLVHGRPVSTNSRFGCVTLPHRWLLPRS
ncbi:MAG: ABC transporter ATP-binding protein [Acidobacteriales bacterium]|nr:ABC transporter ATP-binding protein [Terriglobales bacterium]